MPYEQPRSDIDRMIAALAQRQYGQENSISENDTNRYELNNSRHGQRTGMRRFVHGPHYVISRFIKIAISRNGDIEGIRQTTGNWQKDNNIKWAKHVLMQPLNPMELKRVKSIV